MFTLWQLSYELVVYIIANPYEFLWAIACSQKKGSDTLIKKKLHSSYLRGILAGSGDLQAISNFRVPQVSIKSTSNSYKTWSKSSLYADPTYVIFQISGSLMGSETEKVTSKLMSSVNAVAAQLIKTLSRMILADIVRTNYLFKYYKWPQSRHNRLHFLLYFTV